MKRKRGPTHSVRSKKRKPTEIELRLHPHAHFVVDAKRGAELFPRLRSRARSIRLPESLHPVVCRDTLEQHGILLSYRITDETRVPEVPFLSWKQVVPQRDDEGENRIKEQEQDLVGARRRLLLYAFLKFRSSQDSTCLSAYAQSIWEQMYIHAVCFMQREPGIQWFPTSYTEQTRSILECFLPRVLSRWIGDYVVDRLDELVQEWLRLLVEFTQAKSILADWMWSRVVYLDEDMFPILDLMRSSLSDHGHRMSVHSVHHPLMPVLTQVPFALMHNNDNVEEWVQILKWHKRKSRIQCGNGAQWKVHNSRLRPWSQKKATEMRPLEEEPDELDAQESMKRILNSLVNQKQ